MIPTKITNITAHIPYKTLIESPVVLIEFPFEFMIPTKITSWSYTLYNTHKIPNSLNSHSNPWFPQKY